MAKTRLDVLATILAKISGRSTESFLIEMKAGVIPRMKDPSDLQQEISDAEFERLLAIGDQEKEGIVRWMLAGAMSGPPPPPEN